MFEIITIFINCPILSLTQSLFALMKITFMIKGNCFDMGLQVNGEGGAVPPVELLGAGSWNF